LHFYSNKKKTFLHDGHIFGQKQAAVVPWEIKEMQGSVFMSFEVLIKSF